MQQKISIIVPARNEENNVAELVKRIDTALQQAHVIYEIILIDDYSTDKTTAVAQKLAGIYPLTIYQKKGLPGKAQSLLEGFSNAQYDLLCMIDADLQYPPESIPDMITRIENGADIVVAKRNRQDTSWLRNVLSNGYLYFFAKILHNFSCDVQSGMKVFKKEIIQQIQLNPTPWTFDLEFLLKARALGYLIASEDIIFAERTSGKTKIKLHTAIFQIGWAALKYRFQYYGNESKPALRKNFT